MSPALGGGPPHRGRPRGHRRPRLGSNQRPPGSEPGALSAELRGHRWERQDSNLHGAAAPPPQPRTNACTSSSRGSEVRCGLNASQMVLRGQSSPPVQRGQRRVAGPPFQAPEQVHEVGHRRRLDRIRVAEGRR